MYYFGNKYHHLNYYNVGEQKYFINMNEDNEWETTIQAWSISAQGRDEDVNS